MIGLTEKMTSDQTFEVGRKLALQISEKAYSGQREYPVQKP